MAYENINQDELIKQIEQAAAAADGDYEKTESLLRLAVDVVISRDDMPRLTIWLLNEYEKAGV
jgi:hypothetical protein